MIAFTIRSIFDLFIVLMCLVMMVGSGMMVKYNQFLKNSEIVPIVITDNNTVLYTERIPSPKIAHQIQEAARSNDRLALNKLLIKNHLYVVPMKKGKE